MNSLNLFLPMLSLIFILALVILGYVYLNKKKKHINGSLGITEVHRHYVTTKSYISIVKIGDNFFSLGIGEQSINKISELSLEETEKYFLQKEKLETSNSFSNFFKNAKLLNKNKVVRDEENEKGE